MVLKLTHLIIKIKCNMENEQKCILKHTRKKVIVFNKIKI